MAEIAFYNVTKRYGDTVAVDNASFTVADNEFFCFFGPHTGDGQNDEDRQRNRRDIAPN